MVLTIACLTLFELVGVAVSTLFSLPVPGPVIGMCLFLVALAVRVDLLTKSAPVVNVLLAHFSLLFVPAGAGIMRHADRIAAEWLPISLAILGSSVLTVTATVLTMRYVMRWMHRES